jgi:cytoplasmic iron level regulating protein YaaA (DUF328/UPF0246 family)
MLIILSPAKTLDCTTTTPRSAFTQPRFLADAAELIDMMRQLSTADLKRQMKISESLAQLNAQRFQQWQTPFSLEQAKQAIFAYQGDVYTSLDAPCLHSDEIHYLQTHLRILSGLYGLLRPLDLILPYRLEMALPVHTAHGNSLYQFWRKKITAALNAEFQTMDSPFLINLASNEYAKVINTAELKASIITPVFQEHHKGHYKIVSPHAKKARGAMVRFLATQHSKEVSLIQEFNQLGYSYQAQRSTNTEWIFSRDTDHS